MRRRRRATRANNSRRSGVLRHTEGGLRAALFLGEAKPSQTYHRCMNIALIAHDQKKADIVMLAREFAAFLRGCHLVATGNDRWGASTMKSDSRSNGCSAVRSAAIFRSERGLAVGQVDAVILFARPDDAAAARTRHQRAGACVRRARRGRAQTNLASARLLLRELSREEPAGSTRPRA